MSANEKLVEEIVDCARSHFAWDASDCPETTHTMNAFKEKIDKILKHKTGASRKTNNRPPHLTASQKATILGDDIRAMKARRF